MFKLILACILVSFSQSKTLHKRQNLCDPALDLTKVPDTCTSYYRCVNGYFSIGNCPSNYQFDETIKRCKPTSEVNCVPFGNQCTIDQDYTPYDCFSFYRCKNGYLTIESCPSGLAFDSLSRFCNLRDQVQGCGATTTPAVPVVGGECTSANDLTQVPENCAQFYRCLNGYRSTYTCPAGTKFDSNLKVCNWADQVTCVSGYNGGSGYIQPSTSGSCTSADDLTQVPENCAQFYRCANGIRSTFNCPTGTNFDSNLKVCNYAAQVTCVSGSSDGSDGPLTPSTSGSCTSADDLTQVPGNCSAFYRCANGVRTQQTCGAGTVFDSNLKVCNWPNQVICR